MDRAARFDVLRAVRAAVTVVCLAGCVLIGLPAVANAGTVTIDVYGSGNNCAGGSFYSGTRYDHTSISGHITCDFTVAAGQEGISVSFSGQIGSSRPASVWVDSGTPQSFTDAGPVTFTVPVAAGSHVLHLEGAGGDCCGWHVTSAFVTTAAEPEPTPTPTPTSTSPEGALYAEGSFSDPQVGRAAGLALGLLVFLAAAGLARSFAHGSKA